MVSVVSSVELYFLSWLLLVSCSKLMGVVLVVGGVFCGFFEFWVVSLVFSEFMNWFSSFFDICCSMLLLNCVSLLIIFRLVLMVMWVCFLILCSWVVIVVVVLLVLCVFLFLVLKMVWCWLWFCLIKCILLLNLLVIGLILILILLRYLLFLWLINWVLGISGIICFRLYSLF